MLDSTQRTTAAELLWAAERDLAQVDPLTETFPGIDVARVRRARYRNRVVRMTGKTP
jgi:2-keto-4-pentenoate hydratase